MRRVWALAVVGAAAVGCGETEKDEWLGGPVKTEQSLTTSGTSGGTGGTAATSSVSTSSSASGSGGAACAPLPDACGAAVCGTVDDGCGKQVKCGDCQGTSVCKSGACCYPSMAACDGICDVDVPDGCGGVIHCDSACGDASGLMHCSDAGKCECTAAKDLPGAEDAWTACTIGGTPFPPYYCGGKTKDQGPGCESQNGVTIPPWNYEVWCSTKINGCGK